MVSGRVPARRRAAASVLGWGALLALLSLAVGCNQLTGAGGLKVARCGPDAGPDSAGCETGVGALSERDAGGPSDTNPELGRRVGSGAGSTGGSAGVDPGPPSAPLSCEPGSRVQCLGPDGCSGSQTCQDDGRSFTGCECGPAPVAGAGSVGASCEGDEDCARGLGCSTAQASSGPFLGGGAQDGYCSRPCAGDADCVGSDPGAICVSHASGPAFCFQECSPAQPSFPGQCNGRSDLLCLPLSSGQRGYCAPACQTDGDCAPRACDLGSGLCADSVSEGQAIGGECSANGDCAAGLCLSLPGQPAACTGLCTLGSVAGCGFGESASERSAACTGGAAAGLGLGLGVGLCQELCDVDDDCLQVDSGWGCSPWPAGEGANGLDYEESFNSIGFCEPLASAGSSPASPEPGCNDTCLFASNGSCDDTEAFLPLCDLGTDCSDCGPR